MGWKSVCCALQGRGHLKKNIPCQDKVTRREENGIHVIVLADGAGSAVFSHFGAECVVNCVAEFILKKFFDLITCEDGHKVKKELLSVILKSLEEEAMERKCTIKDLASTLLVAAVSDKNFFLAHLGDGVIGYLNDTGLKTVSTPDNGEFANETFFVTSVNAEAHMKIYKGELKKISGFVLMSDGTEQSLYNKRNKTLAPVIKRLLHRTCLIAPEILTPQLEDALGSVVIDNTYDDCSIALLARTSEQLPPLNELPLSERQTLFKASGNPLLRKVRQIIFRYDEICEILKNPITLHELSRKLHLKKRYVKKKLQRLIEAGIVIRKKFMFKIYCQ